MWIQVYDENDTYIATFGLWSYCEYDANMCMSVHDNIIPGKDVPRKYNSCEPTHAVSSSTVISVHDSKHPFSAWYGLCQWNFLIGLVLNFMTLAILTSNVRNEEVRMSGTIYMASECFSAMAG